MYLSIVNFSGHEIKIVVVVVVVVYGLIASVVNIPGTKDNPFRLLLVLGHSDRVLPLELMDVTQCSLRGIPKSAAKENSKIGR